MVHMEDHRETIEKIREFNRFYTVLLGFLDRNYLDSEYSVTETRILFELKQNHQMSANRLIGMLRLDKSYISRLIRNFERRGLVTRDPSPDDGRALLIQLTPKGLTETDRLIDMTDRQISKLIGTLPTEGRRSLCEAMETIMESLCGCTAMQEGSHEDGD